MAITLDKPAGVPVFPRHGDPAAPCVLAELLAAQPSRVRVPWPEGFAGGIAHRLDIPTSGALWVADTAEELTAMRALFAGRHLTKTYRFVARREVPWSENAVDRPIAHDRGRKKRMVVQRGPNTPHRGRWYPARTAFRHLGDRLWEARMSSGVMHQIRVHAAFVGLVLAGDPIYGGGERPPAASPEAPFLLHHVGLEGGGHRTDPVSLPKWAQPE